MFGEAASGSRLPPPKRSGYQVTGNRRQAVIHGSPVAGARDIKPGYSLSVRYQCRDAFSASLHSIELNCGKDTLIELIG